MAEGGDTDTTIVAGDVEGIFYGDGEAMEGTEGLACGTKVEVEVGGAGEGVVEERFGEAGGQLIGNRCSLGYFSQILYKAYVGGVLWGVKRSTLQYAVVTSTAVRARFRRAARRRRAV